MRITWEYIAGFFDGEGCVCTTNLKARPNTFCTFVSIGQSGKEGYAVLTAIQAFLVPYGIKSYMSAQRRQKHYREMWQLRMMARPSVMVFLSNVLPFVNVKRPAVQDTLRFHKMYPSVRALVCAEKSSLLGELNLVARGLDAAGIKADRSTGMSFKKLMAKYGTTENYIRRIVCPEFYHRINERNRQRKAELASATA